MSTKRSYSFCWILPTDLTRFLWYRLTDDDGSKYFTDEAVPYSFVRLPFGLTCSPFLLLATLRESSAGHSEDFPVVAPLINRNMYMDDFAASHKEESNLITMYGQRTATMNTIHLPMSKWARNSTTNLDGKLKVYLHKRRHKSSVSTGTPSRIHSPSPLRPF